MLSQLEVLAELDDMDTGLTFEEKVTLVQAMFASPTRQRTALGSGPVRAKRVLPDAEYHQPVWALLDRPFGISRGFQLIQSCERVEEFDMDDFALDV